MKTSGTRVILVAIILQLMLLIACISAKAQPDFTFRNAVLISGTNLQIGAVYRFSNVKPGIDGIISIKDIKNGMTLVALDGGSGFDEAFQPEIYCAPKKKGYVEFQLDLVQSGTNNAVFVPELPLTAIDIDGWQFPDEKIYETDEFEHSPSFYVAYDLIGSNLDVKTASGWTSATNKNAVTYDGIDTVQRDVMFTAVHGNVTKVLFRVGADNRSKNSITRLRSVYFKKFNYALGHLAKSALLSFRGLEKNKKVELSWALQANHKIGSVVIEKSISSSSFKTIGEVSAGSNIKFIFTDNEIMEGNAQYRLKLINLDGKVEYSNMLAFRNNDLSASTFKIYPSAIQSNATMNVKSVKTGTAVFELIDYSGRLLFRQNVAVQEGYNNIQLNSIGSITSGNYLAILKIDNNVYTQKINKL